MHSGTRVQEKLSWFYKTHLADLESRNLLLRVKVLNTNSVMRFDAFSVVKIRILFFWIIALCALANGYLHFGGICRRQLHGEDMLRMRLNGVASYKTTNCICNVMSVDP